jgi:predicted molibdopterin-dependent oxidoreductase YjgC
MNLHIKDDMIYRVEAPFDAAPNYGNLCVKGRFGLDFTTHPRRLTKPLIRDGERGKFREATWDEALIYISEKLAQIVRESGGDSVATYACAKATNEDNYIFQKFVRAVLKTNNVDHCARLCHAGSVTGLQLAIGSSAMSNSISSDLFSPASPAPSCPAHRAPDPPGPQATASSPGRSGERSRRAWPIPSPPPPRRRSRCRGSAPSRSTG